LLHCGGWLADSAIEVVDVITEGGIVALELEPEVEPSRQRWSVLSGELRNNGRLKAVTADCQESQLNAPENEVFSSAA
jgi:hypothetical protein